MKRCTLLLIFFLFTIVLKAQGNFEIQNNKGRFKQKIELVNGLVILPVEVNGVELSFLLDTGINSTVIFSLANTDSLEVKNATTIYLSGLGGGKPVRAIKSSGNTLQLGDAVGMDQTLFIATEEVVGISHRLGIPVNGILGYDFFKNFIIEFNYPREFMKVYAPSVYKYRRCRRCADLPLTFKRNKPYIMAVVQLPYGEDIPVNLLLDSGSGDAVWLFVNDEKNIRIPPESFEDFLGFGISGSIYGDRSRMDYLKLDKHEFEEVTVSFPDTMYVGGISAFEDRDGSLGAQVLKRFHSVMDYPNKRLRLRPNRYFNDSFEYNMSGVIVEHHGYKLIEEQNFERNPAFSVEKEQNNELGVPVYRSTYKVKFSLEPQYRIAEIRPDSPAAKSGLKKGDVIISLNGRPVYRYSLGKISSIFSSREGRRIRLVVERNGENMKFEFRLEKIL